MDLVSVANHARVVETWLVGASHLHGSHWRWAMTYGGGALVLFNVRRAGCKDNGARHERRRNRIVIGRSGRRTWRPVCFGVLGSCRRQRAITSIMEFLENRQEQ